MSRLNTGEWIVFVLLVIACVANLTGKAYGGIGAAIIWGVLAVLYARWRIRKDEEREQASSATADRGSESS